MDPWNELAKVELDTIDEEVMQYQMYAERKCQKIYKQPLAFSIPVQHWVRKWWGY